MKQEILRDPNFPLAMQSKNDFRSGGKNLIALMRKMGIKKPVRDQMRVYLAKTENAMMKTNRRAMFKELTKAAHPTYTGTMAETFGTFYPDDIPVDTYVKMKQDPQIAIGLAIIKLPLVSLNWVIDCDDKDVAAFVTESIKLIWRRLIKSMLTAIDFGFASHEKVWWRYPMDISSVTATGRKKTHFSGVAEIYKKIKAHYPDTIRIRTEAKTGDFLGIIQEIGGGDTVSLDKDKCFFFAIEDDFGNYFGGSRLKNAYKPWYWKEVLYQFMLRYYERRGSPPTIVTFPPGVNLDASGNEVDNAAVALKIGQSLIENSVVTIPFEETKDGRENQWKVNYLHDEKRGEMFIQCISHLETQMLRGLLIPERTVTQDISTGSYSMAASHAEAFLLAQEGLISQIEDSINEQLIPPLVEFNFKPKQRIPCRLQLEEIQHGRKKLLKEIYVEIIRNINTFAKAGMVPNLLPSLSEMGNILKIPMATFDEEYVNISPTNNADGNGAGNVDQNVQPVPSNSKTNNKGKKETSVATKKVIPMKRKAAVQVIRNPVIV